MRRKIGFSIFETQILRNYVLSDSAEFLRDLAREFDVYLFTAPSNKGKFEEIIRGFEIPNITIKAFEAPPFPGRLKTLLSLMRWLDPGSSYLRTLMISRNRQNLSGFGVLLRLLFRYTFARSSSVKRLMRQALSIASKKYGFAAVEEQDLPSLDLLILTSLTDRESDVPLSFIYRNAGVQILGTVRSWDNLVTKGALPFEPDQFISHSPYMTRSIPKYQGFSPGSVIELCSPSYRLRFISALSQKYLQKRGKVLFVCMGPEMNPDEYDFIVWLGSLMKKLNLDLSILQHPKFRHDLGSLSPEIKILTFNYDQTSLFEYYDFLRHHTLVIGGGTTAMLDALFVGTRVLFIAFEIRTRDRWSSYLRGYEYQPHLREFINSSKPNIAHTATDLEKFLAIEPTPYELLESLTTLSDFVGDLRNDFFDGLRSIIRNMLFEMS